MLALALGATILLLPPLAGTVLVVAMVLALDEVLLPVTYRLDERGVSVSTALRRKSARWNELTEVRPTPVGLLVRFGARRSWHLLTPTDQKALEYARARMPGTDAAVAES